jgi:hypothetical protein
MRVILQALSQIQCISSRLRYVNCGPGHIQGIYSSACLDRNIQLKVGPLLLEISRQFNALYTANLVSNTAHIVQITLCELWSRAYTRYLQLRILRLQLFSCRFLRCHGRYHMNSVRVILQTLCQIQRTTPVYAM